MLKYSLMGFSYVGGMDMTIEVKELKRIMHLSPVDRKYWIGIHTESEHFHRCTAVDVHGVTIASEYAATTNEALGLVMAALSRSHESFTIIIVQYTGQLR